MTNLEVVRVSALTKNKIQSLIFSSKFLDVFYAGNFHNPSVRYTTTDLRILLYVCVDVKAIP